MAPSNILVVDDEKNIVHLARLYLTAEGYRVETAYNGREALAKAKATSPDLVVLDLMMPELDGWEVCRRLRQESDVPIIILTARGDDADKIQGLELGADDYVTKPFNPKELVARVKAVLRRYQAADRITRRLSAGDIQLDLDRREVTVSGSPATLRAKEFDLLAAFMKNQGVVMDRERLLNEVWGFDYLGDTRTIDVHITWLRDKIEGSHTTRITTVWGVGYKLVVSEEGSANVPKP
ncbi:MAG TPA: response regulator transcription factor [Chloroflexota bacterium]|nr:response regulator transcription factor [Chloroflexota bacterium]